MPLVSHPATLGVCMLSTDLVRKLLDDPSLTDDQIEDICATSHALAELVFVAWRNRQLEKKSASADSTPNPKGL